MKRPIDHPRLRPGTIPSTIEGTSYLRGGDFILAVQGKRIGDETSDGRPVELTAAKP